MIVKVNGKLIEDLELREQNKAELVRGLKFALPASVIIGASLYAIDSLSSVEVNTAFLRYKDASYFDKLIEVLETAVDLAV